MLISFTGWFFNINLVTDKRILILTIGVFFISCFRNAAEYQDVTYNISGLAATFLNYGNLYIQTAGTSANFDFAAVPTRPLYDLITDLIQRKNV